MSNLDLYNKVRNVPSEAKKSIRGGRLKGMTDINPMWRIKTLTEYFGVVGFGWYYDIIDKQIIEGANGEKIATVDIKLFIKQGEEWSKGITGTGGSMLIAKERSGLYTSDEAFKMALTDAISVACKSLGIGADVYFEKDLETKYQQRANYQQQATQEDMQAKEAQKLLFATVKKKNIDSATMTKLIQEKYKKGNSNELTYAEINGLRAYIEQMH